MLLIVLVGAGFTLAVANEHRRWFRPAAVSAAAGAGLVAFETVECAWIGPHPLQAVIGALGVAVMLLGLLGLVYAFRHPDGHRAMERPGRSA